MHTIKFFEIKEYSHSLLARLNALLAQLSSTAAPMTPAALQALIAAPDSHLYALAAMPEGAADAGCPAAADVGCPSAADGTHIVAMCTLATYLAPTGRKAWIEDVVVDSQMRGQKLGRLLIDRVVDEARRLAPCSLMLTSRPARVAANALYKSAGFEQRETNVYKRVLSFEF